jgi:hypothetical protein
MKITKIKDVDNYNKDSIYEIEDHGMKVKVMIPWSIILESQEFYRKNPEHEEYFGLNLVFGGNHYE